MTEKTDIAWLEHAWAAEGVCEIPGEQENLDILAYFADVGRSDVKTEVTPWCAAFAGACLTRAGVSVESIPSHRRLLARSYASIGTGLKAPRVGCIVVLKRGDNPSAGHVGFCVGWTETHVKILGGNQSNAVNVQQFKRDDVIAYRWPQAQSMLARALKSKTIAGAVTGGVGAIGAMAENGAAIALDAVAETTKFEPLKALAPNWKSLSLALAIVGFVIAIGARLRDAQTGKHSG